MTIPTRERATFTRTVLLQRRLPVLSKSSLFENSVCLFYVRGTPTRNCWQFPWLKHTLLLSNPDVIQPHICYRNPQYRALKEPSKYGSGGYDNITTGRSVPWSLQVSKSRRRFEHKMRPARAVRRAPGTVSLPKDPNVSRVYTQNQLFVQSFRGLLFNQLRALLSKRPKCNGSYTGGAITHEASIRREARLLITFVGCQWSHQMGF